MTVYGKLGKDDETVFPNLPTDLGNRYNRFPHSHPHDYHEELYLLITAELRDTHSEGKVSYCSPLCCHGRGRGFEPRRPRQHSK